MQVDFYTATNRYRHRKIRCDKSSIAFYRFECFFGNFSEERSQDDQHEVFVWTTDRNLGWLDSQMVLPMNSRLFSIVRFAMIAGAACLATSCSTGVFFADDNQEGHVGFLSATQYSKVSDVLILEKGAAPKLTEEALPKPEFIPRIADPTVVKTDTLLKNDTELANKAPRYDIPIVKENTQPVAEVNFVSSPR